MRYYSYLFVKETDTVLSLCTRTASTRTIAHYKFSFFELSQHQNVGKYRVRCCKHGTEWFYQQNEFKTEFESIEVNEMNKCLSKFYVSVRRKDFVSWNIHRGVFTFVSWNIHRYLLRLRRIIVKCFSFHFTTTGSYSRVREIESLPCVKLKISFGLQRRPLQPQAIQDQGPFSRKSW